MARPSHVQFMRRALELALQGRGKTSPNPMVGCVIAKQGRILAEGLHRKAGTDHAEIVALKKLSQSEMEGATLYVTMEPCSIQGKTPPCAPRLIRSGIQRVVVGARDPNPKVNGGGLALLKKGGIEVIEGILHQECATLNKPFEKFITQKMPYVTLKVALSLDGKVATSSGDSKWLSNKASRHYVHQLRGEVDAILVGGGTLRQDDPLLTVRLPHQKNRRQPTVVIVDTTLELPTKRKLFERDGRRIIVATTPHAAASTKRLLEKKGAEIWNFDADLTGRIDLKSLLRRLGEEGMTHLLVEGGASIFSSFIGQRMVDRVIAFLTPKLLGGQALDWLPDLHIKKMKEAFELKNVAVKTFGNDILLQGELK